MSNQFGTVVTMPHEVVSIVKGLQQDRNALLEENGRLRAENTILQPKSSFFSKAPAVKTPEAVKLCAPKDLDIEYQLAQFMRMIRISDITGKKLMELIMQNPELSTQFKSYLAEQYMAEYQMNEVTFQKMYDAVKPQSENDDDDKCDNCDNCEVRCCDEDEGWDEEDEEDEEDYRYM